MSVKYKADNTAADTTAVDYYVVDAVSTTSRFGSNWWANIPGNSGSLPVTPAADQFTAADELDFEPVNLVSMYRKHDLVELNRQYKANAWNDGTTGGSWAASSGRINITGHFVGTPGSVHRPPVGTEIDYAKAPASLPATSVIINEVRNDTADANLDWIELHNTGTADVEIKKWTIDMVIGTDAAKNPRIVEFPDAGYAKIPAGGFLVIYNRDPADTILADGINIADPLNERVQKGATHMYFVDSDLKLVNDDQFLLVLRNGNDKTTMRRSSILRVTGSSPSPTRPESIKRMSIRSGVGRFPAIGLMLTGVKIRITPSLPRTTLMDGMPRSPETIGSTRTTGNPSVIKVVWVMMRV